MNSNPNGAARAQRRLFLFVRATEGMAQGLLFTAMMVYFITVVHMTPLQLVLTGTALEATMFVCQVPTGILADAFSRRWSVVAGYALMGVAYLAMGFQPSFAVIAGAQVVLGVGWSAIEGATEAWIAGEVGDADLSALFIRAGQVGTAGNLGGIGLMVALGWRNVALPIVAGGALFCVLALVLALVMREREHPHGHLALPPASRIGATVRGALGVLRGRRAIAVMLLVGICFGLSSEGFDRLQTAHLLDDLGMARWPLLPPLGWITAVEALEMAVAAGAMQLALRWRQSMESSELTPVLVAGATVVRIGALAAFALAPAALVAVPVMYCAETARSLTTALYYAWLTRRTDPSVRATVLSLAGQSDALGQIVGGPPVGWIGSVVSIPAALLATAAYLLPSVPLAAWVRASSNFRADT